MRIEVGFMGAYSPGELTTYGFGGMFEPKFNLHDQIAIGVRLEGVALFGGSISGGGTSVSVGLRAVTAYLLKADYFFTTTGVRPFVGLGLGMYNSGGTSGGTGGASVTAVRAFGMMPQVGVNFGGFRLAFVYHIVFAPTLEVTVNSGSGAKMSRNYFGLELAGTILGRRKDRKK